MEQKLGTKQASVVCIKPSRGWVLPQMREVWTYRELLYFLVWRDFKVRYKQTALGALWAIIKPFSLMVIFSIFFGKLAKIPSEGMPYPIFTYAALLPWSYFAQSLGACSNSLVGNSHLITKVYFPRLIIPISSVLSGLVDFAISFSILLAMMFYYKIIPTLAVVLLPLLILMAMATALGAGLWLSALNVQYRDIRFTLSFLVQFWFFATPVVYPSNLVPERWRFIYSLNPMAGVVEGFRGALLGKGQLSWVMFTVSIVVIATIIITGAFYFRRTEKGFADVV
ncbi:MAG: ABC transporter permease [Candidatus Hodarchaeota archaeon]